MAAVDDMKHQIMEFVHILEYVESVSKEIGKQKALDILKNTIVSRRIRWFEKNKDKLYLTGKPLEDAYSIMTQRLKLLDNVEIRKKSDKTISFATTKPCPVHEACKVIKSDSKNICKAVCEDATNDFLSKIIPKVKFTIDHKKNGSEEYIIETIELKK
jgi:hypothetical protein